MRAIASVSSSSSLSPSVVASTLIAVIFCLTMPGAPALAQEEVVQPAQAAAPRALITQSVDESQLTTLRGNTHPLARPQFDLGTAQASLPMQRMLLVLKRSPDQETALRKLLDDQQDKASPSYHKWLTPERFGKQFGPTDTDMQTITAWLQSHGFQVGSTKGRTVLEFSGTAGQVREAFHTTIHKYLVNGEQHWANATDPQIPSALTPAVAGVLTLHNFIKKPTIHFSGEPIPAKLVSGKKPQVTFTENGQVIHALSPQDYRTIYNISAVSVTGETSIAVVGRSNLYNGGQDVANFQSLFGGGTFFAIVNGPDPGDPGGGEEAEATLDSSWSAAIAPGATVRLVVSGTTNTTDGIDLSEVYIVEQDLAAIMTESFSSCELLATDAQLAFASGLAEQAAAQGITYVVSTGDNGAEGCDDPSLPPAAHPISVNLLASTAFNVAVGGTMFNENGQDSKYWGTEPPVQESAISYIPENVWNESSLTNGLWAGSGGASAGNIQGGMGGTTPGVPKPAWQSPLTLGIPSDGVRDLPDVSLTAAAHDPYLLCLEGSCAPNSQGQFYVYFVSGTSASAPSFAGIMALVDDQNSRETGELRQGLANYVLYRLAAAQAAYPSQCNGSNTSTPPVSTCVFNDVTVGNNVVPGEVGTQYQSTPGYDLATGLGSVNVANLVSQWNTVTFNPTMTVLSVTPSTITHGSPVPFTVTVTPNPGTGVPTGNVSLTAYTPGDTPPINVGVWTLAGGSVSSTITSLPGGTTWVGAYYAGDATFAPSTAVPSNTFTVKPEPSTTTLSLQVTDLLGNPLTSPYPFGSLVFVRADVAGQSKQGFPTGSVNFTDSFGPLPSVNPQVNPPVQVPNPSPLNSQGNTSIGDGIVSFDAGNHSISGIYGGDPSFNPSPVSNSVSFTIQPGFVAVSGPTNVSISAPGASGATNIGTVASTGFTTAITFTCSNLPSEAQCLPASATGQGPAAVVSTNITVTTTAPHTVMLHSGQRRYYYALLLGGGLPLAGIFLLPGHRRRWSRFAGLMLIALLITLPGCGGGGGGSPPQQDPGTPAGTYKVTLTATAGTLTQQGAFYVVLK